MYSILILEDHPATLDWITDLVVSEFQPEKLYTSKNIAEAKLIIEQHGEHLDLAIIDANLPDGNGIDLITALKRLERNVYSTIFTILDDEDRILQALLLGADGYILKNASKTEMAHYLSEVLNGMPALSQSVIKKLLRLVRNNLAHKNLDLVSSLSDREKQVLVYLAKGYSKKEISLETTLSEHTIKDYGKRIYKKLNINNVAEATYIALNSGLIN